MALPLVAFCTPRIISPPTLDELAELVNGDYYNRNIVNAKEAIHVIIMCPKLTSALKGLSSE